VLTEFFVAMQFLTIVRMRNSLPFDDETLGRAGAFFPAVGLLIGGAAWGLAQCLFTFFPPSLSTIFVVAALVVLSRGLHLDGLADSADGLFGGSDPQRRLAIMKDSRIGVFGALALFGIVLLKVRALDLLLNGGRTTALLIGPIFGRWACVVMAYSAPPAREEGLGAFFIQGVQFRELALASLFTLVVGFFLTGALTFVLFGTLTVVALGVTRYCTRRLGGVTGDTLGAVSEVVETAAFCLLSALAGRSSIH
jgi:adenosylcobinamide-GDP ribazoletransferase